MKNWLYIFMVPMLALAQQHSHVSHRAIDFPDILNYRTLSTDLHMHSVFSDGNVWPSIRVQEALMDNLDAISLTEHLEYQPHSKDIPHPDRNRAFELAMAEAKDHDLLIISGSEITRGAPVGHNNAIFLSDSNTILKETAEEAFNAAHKQGAFVFWNHPAWSAQSPQGNPNLSAFQQQRIAEDQLHGIEVVNFGAYAEESLQIALDQNLTIMATSDVHDLIEWDYTNKGLQRPVTLVFAKEKSIGAIKEALFERRTVAAYNDLLIGREDYLIPLIEASVSVKVLGYEPKTQILKIELTNNCSSDLLFENVSQYNFYESSPVFNLKSKTTKILQLKTLKEQTVTVLTLKALGAYTAPKTHPLVNFELKTIP